MGRLCLLVALLLAPVVTYGQDEDSVDVAALVEELNSQCPIYDGENWCISSFTAVEDRYVLVDAQLPSNISMFLSSLSSEDNRVTRLWINQFSQYGERWERFVDAMIETDRRIIVNLRPAGSAKTALITFTPSDFAKYR